MNHLEIASALKNRRLVLGLSKENVCRYLQISRPTLDRLENGENAKRYMYMAYTYFLDKYSQEKHIL